MMKSGMQPLEPNNEYKCFNRDGEPMKRALILAGGGSRGAFHIGVWKYLCDRNWNPDIICGTSVGAINGAGICSGLTPEALARLWTTTNRQKMYRLNLMPFLSWCITGQSSKPILNNQPLQSIISRQIDFDRIRNSRTRLVVSAVNVHTAQPCFFNNEQIRIEHILASSAMPVIFPWQMIDGVPHWDGGIMANIPLQPALEFGADEIIIVFLSPVGHRPQQPPGTVREAAEHVFEQFLSGSYQAALTASGCNDTSQLNPQKKYTRRCKTSGNRTAPPNIVTLAPPKMLGFRSLLNFSIPQAKKLIDEGYKIAHTKLKPFI